MKILYWRLKKTYFFASTFVNFLFPNQLQCFSKVLYSSINIIRLYSLFLRDTATPIRNTDWLYTIYLAIGKLQRVIRNTRGLVYILFWVTTFKYFFSFLLKVLLNLVNFMLFSLKLRRYPWFYYLFCFNFVAFVFLYLLLVFLSTTNIKYLFLRLFVKK